MSSVSRGKYVLISTITWQFRHASASGVLTVNPYHTFIHLHKAFHVFADDLHIIFERCMNAWKQLTLPQMTAIGILLMSFLQATCQDFSESA